MNRRQFIAALAAAGLLPPFPAAAQNPFDPDPELFPLEREAQEISGHLNRLTEIRKEIFKDGNYPGSALITVSKQGPRAVAAATTPPTRPPQPVAAAAP